MRAPARRYLRSALGDGPETPKTEPEAVEMLILEHRRSSYELHPLSWFGRLLWRLFGRWL